MSSNQTKSLSYRDAGVNIDAGNEFVEKIKSSVASTHRPGVMGSLGGFGGLFELPENYRQPVLVSGTDGVGTKLKLAIDLNKHDTIGIDLVAMCVNDILVLGAEPLYFLDYYATGELNSEIAASVVEGIAEGCRQSNAALIGGETAEMPGMYGKGDYDLAGFCVGVVEKQEIIDGSKVKAGDAMIAIASSGPHSNGYSLVRKIIEVSGADINQSFDSTGPAPWVMHCWHRQISTLRPYTTCCQNLIYTPWLISLVAACWKIFLEYCQRTARLSSIPAAGSCLPFFNGCRTTAM